MDPNLFVAFNLTEKDLLGPISRRISTEVCDVPVQQAVGEAVIEIEPSDAEGIATLALRIHSLPRFALLSVSFIAEQVFEWLMRGATNSSHHVQLMEYLDGTLGAVQEREIWFPIAGLRIRDSVPLGRVTFEPITKGMIDDLETRMNKAPQSEASVVAQAILRTRKMYQGRGAAVVRLLGEKRFAIQEGKKFAEKAVGLLRFVSPANLAPDFRTQWALSGQHQMEEEHWLEVRNGSIGAHSRGIAYKGDTFDAFSPVFIKEFPDLLQRLHHLASTESESEFKRDLVAALLLYSRNSVTTNSADKLVYILVALESLLLKNSSEPIQSGIGERLAFICGRNADERLDIAQTIKQV